MLGARCDPSLLSELPSLDFSGIRGHKRQVRPTPREYVEDVRAVVVRCTLSAADDDNLATNECRRVRATRWRQVPLHIRMRPMRRICEGTLLFESQIA
jgi:hypothetical protein